MKKRGIRGQIWIETVIYTLIAFFMIGIVLAFVRPKILEFQDKIIIDRSINLMDHLNNNILSIAQAEKETEEQLH